MSVGVWAGEGVEVWRREDVDEEEGEGMWPELIVLLSTITIDTADSSAPHQWTPPHDQSSPT
jgi:hypothetical protein